MKILVYGINYYPELTGIGKYTGEMCAWLAARGHEVEVITALPYYPEWKIREDYKNKGGKTELIQGVRVRRTPLYVPEKVTGFSRIRHEISFVFNSSRFWFKAFFRRYDVVIGICPPLQAGVFPYLYKVLRRRPFIFHIQDLQVDAAKELGLVKNKFLLNTLIGIERFLVRRATRVSSISEGMRRKILAKGMKEENYIHLPNWSDVDFMRPLPKEASMRKHFGIPDDAFVALYSGNMGDKQGLEIILQAAEILKDEPVYFFMAGEGAAKKKLILEAERKKLRNVQFSGLQAYEDLPAFLAMADIHLVVQKKAASDLVLPSKLMSILSAGGVSLVTAVPGSTLYDLMNLNNLGVVVEPERVEALVEGIRALRINDSDEYRKNARSYAEKELAINTILSKFESNLEELLSVTKR
ncbi:MAG: WcaI family glycosyltransferase [Cytophagaceae bacterium]